MWNNHWNFPVNFQEEYIIRTIEFSFQWTEAFEWFWYQDPIFHFLLILCRYSCPNLENLILIETENNSTDDLSGQLRSYSEGSEGACHVDNQKKRSHLQLNPDIHISNEKLLGKIHSRYSVIIVILRNKLPFFKKNKQPFFTAGLLTWLFSIIVVQSLPELQSIVSCSAKLFF